LAGTPTALRALLWVVVIIGVAVLLTVFMMYAQNAARMVK
jgi:hypothetical protein